MPFERTIESAYLGPFSHIELFHQATLYKPGELGARVVVAAAAGGVGAKEYQLVQVDSGATSATPTGALLQGQTLYWKNKQPYVVTNDSRFSIYAASGTRPSVQPVAGILRNPSTGTFAVVPGDFAYIQTKGQATGVLASAGTLGDFAIPNNSATAANLSNVAPGSNLQDTVVGRFETTVAAGAATVDLQLPEIP